MGLSPPPLKVCCVRTVSRSAYRGRAGGGDSASQRISHASCLNSKVQVLHHLPRCRPISPDIWAATEWTSPNVPKPDVSPTELLTNCSKRQRANLLLFLAQIESIPGRQTNVTLSPYAVTISLQGPQSASEFPGPKIKVKASKSFKEVNSS